MVAGRIAGCGPPRPGRTRIDRQRLLLSARRVFARLEEPPVKHLGPITFTVQELAALIRASLSRGPLSFEELTRGRDRRRAVAGRNLGLRGRRRRLRLGGAMARTQT